MRINWMNYSFEPFEGYGRHGMFLIRELTRSGVTVRPATKFMYDEYMKIPAATRHLAPFFDYRHVTVTMMVASEFPRLPGRTWGLTMYEADRIPPEWAKRMNATCERVIVPCEHNRRIFEENGVCVPVHVVEEGIDPVEFPILPPAARERPFTFLALGDRGVRKGIETVWLAFYRAFPADLYPDVRLMVKSRAHNLGSMNEQTFDGRVLFWREDVGSMSEVYAQADCLVYPAYGEGWGLPPRECAAMGVPVIVPRHSGLEHGIDFWATRIIEKIALRPAVMMPPDGAMWYVPDIDETAAHMKWVYEHHDEARRKAQECAAWLHRNQTWAQAGKQLFDLLEEHIWHSQQKS